MVPVVAFILVLVMAKNKTSKDNIKALQLLALRFKSTRRCNSPKVMMLLVPESRPSKASQESHLQDTSVAESTRDLHWTHLPMSAEILWIFLHPVRLYQSQWPDHPKYAYHKHKRQKSIEEHPEANSKRHYCKLWSYYN